jgi:predicted AlkP superfamily pyrophosphatase or phosphodiesterase
MKKIFVVLLLANLALVASAQKKKVVFMIVDGIPADLIEKVNTPNLDAIAKVGGYKRAYVGGEKGGYSQTPTISAVGYNSLLTGTWVNKHNVWDNDIKAPNYSYHNLFRILETQSPKKKTAIFSTWLDNRTKLVGDGLAAAGGIAVDHHIDGLEHDTIRFKHDKEAFYIHKIDEEVTNKATAYIKEEAPDLTWIYLEYTDDMGHMFGNSGRFEKAIEIMDHQVGRIWEAIQRRQTQNKEDWEIYITTDHGRDSELGKNHGGQSDRERTTWIVTNAKGLNDYWKKSNPAIVDIMPSIADALNLKMSRDQKMEVDGISLTGAVSAIEPKAVLLDSGKIEVKWKALEQKGNVKIWLATTNNFKTGGKDVYKQAGSAALTAESAIIDVSKTPSEFYKIVIEAPNNMLNRWIVK